MHLSTLSFTIREHIDMLNVLIIQAQIHKIGGKHAYVTGFSPV
jgi:hypothetical protein